MDKEIYIESKTREISDRIKNLNPNNKSLIEDVCDTYDKYLKQFKDYWFLYRVIVPKESNIWVLYYDKEANCEKSDKFLITISNWLEESVITWDNLAIQEKHLGILIDVWEDKLNELEKC